jgi:uncharacterized protein (DUF779 family)
MYSNDHIEVIVTADAIEYIKSKGASAVTVMLAKSGGC